MKIDYGTHYLMRFANGKLWSFFSDNQGNINFKSMSQDNGSEGQSIVISDVKKEFGITMDESENLHLVCSSYNGEIIYMNFRDNKWSRHVLSKWDANKHSIRYPSTLVLDYKVHIIFAMANTPAQKNWSLYHYYLYDEGWGHEKITEFSIDGELGPFYTDVYNKDIHLTYGGILNEQVHTYHAKYQDGLEQWLKPHTHDDYGEELVPNQEPLLSEQVEDLVERAEKAFKDHISITRESDELRRRCMESKRQWELILEELNEFKIASSKLRKKSILGNLLRSILQ